MGPALLLALATTAPVRPSPAIDANLFGSAPAAGVHFANARIGMSLNAWRALPAPKGMTAEARPECAPGAAGALICDYDAHVGKYVVTQSVPITSRYRARDPKYIFAKGRLIQIRFRTSVNAFNAVSAAIERAYGPASQTARNDGLVREGLRLPRVRKVWRGSTGSIVLVDPSSRLDELSVELSSGVALAPRPG